jgi:hypothetical protein
VGADDDHAGLMLVGQGEQAVGGAGVDHGRGGLDHAAGDQADRLLGQGLPRSSRA